jgi:SAM-dependent methyltransferase
MMKFTNKGRMKLLMVDAKIQNPKKPCPVCAGDMHGFKETDIDKKWKILFCQCQNCGLIHSFEDSFYKSVLYSNHYFQDVDSGWKERGNEFSAIFDRHFRKHKPLKVLDIGSGTNYFVSRLVQAGYDAYGVDAHSEPVYAKDRFYRDFDILPNDSFDVIILLEVIEHLTAPLEELEGFFSRLKDNGKVFFTTMIYWKKRQKSMEWYINPQFGHATIWSMGALSKIFCRFKFKTASIYRSGNLQIWDRTPGSLLNTWQVQANISRVRAVFGHLLFRLKAGFDDLL